MTFMGPRIHQSYSGFMVYGSMGMMMLIASEKGMLKKGRTDGAYYYTVLNMTAGYGKPSQLRLYRPRLETSLPTKG